MSFVTDTNLLLYAINSDSEFHDAARKFIETCMETDETWVFPWPVTCGFLRISTHPAILPHPLTPLQATTVLEQFFELPNVVSAGEEELAFWEKYSKSITMLHLRGNAMTDAHIVSIMETKGVSLIYSKDRDFHKFPGIKVVDPLK